MQAQTMVTGQDGCLKVEEAIVDGLMQEPEVKSVAGAERKVEYKFL
jgi:hypothetical protein